MPEPEGSTRTIPPSAAPGPALRAGHGEHPGDHVGPYRLLEVVGEGGFGTVWLAEQKEPIARRVALKIIKPGMDSKEVIARFEQERQALALMDHPHIARVHDAGTTAAGRPYFAMEFVKGAPITDYCDRARLTIAQRLELFSSVCDAVQHAHMKGIIHRDLKPSNILVAAPDAASARAPSGGGDGSGASSGTPSGALANVKIIDFGVAKALASRLTEKTIFTERGQLIGTPEYMSPEQAEMAETDIDTRTDVYALGVILYELLAGALPFDPKTLRAKGYNEIQRIIREVDPPKPSTRLSALREESAENEPGASATGRCDQSATAMEGSSSIDGRRGTSGHAIALSRRTDLPTLTRELKRELDWIPLRAMRKQRSERYRTASELGDDIANYLSHRPLIAGPESTTYRVKKFVRRNRIGVMAGAAVLAALILGLAGTAWQFTEARTQAQRADERAQAAEKAQKAEKERADELKQVSDFQADMLAQVDPTESGKQLTDDIAKKFAEALDKAGVPAPDRAARTEVFTSEWKRINATDAARELIDATILKPAVEAIDKQFKDQPLVDAQLRQVLATRYRNLGLYEASFPLQESALTTRRRVLGEEHPHTLTSVANMGALLEAQGKLDAAEPYWREALEKRRRVLGEEHPNTLGSIANMASLLQAQGKLSEAEPYSREALEKNRRVRGEEHPETLTSISRMGFLLHAQGKLSEVEPYWREALEKYRRVLGEEHAHTLASIANMGHLLQSQGKLSEAEPYSREALEKRRRLLGEEHPDTLASINNMGHLLQAQGKLAEAEPYYRESMEKHRRVLGEEHPNTLGSITNMASLLQAQGKLSEAEPYYREALEKFRRMLGEEHPGTLISTNNMGRLLQAQGKLSEAEPYFREALEKRRRVLGEEHPDTLGSINNMGFLLQAQGRFSEAEPYYREALEKYRRVLGEEHLHTLNSISNMGSLLRAQGKPVEAIDLIAPAEPAARKAFTGANARRFASLLTTLGRARTAQGIDNARFALAEANLLEAHGIFVTTRGEKHQDTRDCAQGLVELYQAWDAGAPGKGYDIKGAEWKAKLDAGR